MKINDTQSNKRISKKKLNELFYNFLKLSEFEVIEHNNNGDLYKIIIKDNVRKFELYYVLKNVSDSGWTENENIKRIQVGNIKENIITTNKKRTHMLCGITEVEGKCILIVWNSYRYLNHSTNRSCYVYKKSIEDAKNNGYILVNDFDQEIWLCDEKHFSLLIRDYINFNYME